jgi:hypothetical protein
VSMPWLPIHAGQDHLQQYARRRPIDALVELIWNGLDAEADLVEGRAGRNPRAYTGSAVTGSRTRAGGSDVVAASRSPRLTRRVCPCGACGGRATGDRGRHSRSPG